MDLPASPADYVLSFYLKGSAGGEVVSIGKSGGEELKCTLTTAWVRYDVLIDNASGTTYFYIYDTTTAHDTFYVFGPMLNAGTFASSYAAG